MRIIITGASGQLGRELVQLLEKRHEVFGLCRTEMDITNIDQTRKVIRQINPDVVIHTAAYTAVDLAETEEDKAYQINTFGTRNVALSTEEIGAKICYISTDYVFDGNSTVPYREYDNTNPQNVYGKSKRAGELFVQSLSSKYFIVRTSWIYGIHGNNFVKTMLKLASEKNNLKVVNDQIGSPTYTKDLSIFLAELILTDKYGIYHASNTGFCSWYEFALAVFEYSGINIKVEPCRTEEFSRPAPRPKFSVLEHLSIRANGFQDLRNWKDGLRDFIRELGGTVGS
jgi:dTDP-4-dehydrorhamnose reductase